MRTLFLCLILTALSSCSLQRKAVVWWKYRGEYPIPHTAAGHKAPAPYPQVQEHLSQDPDSASQEPIALAATGAAIPAPAHRVFPLYKHSRKAASLLKPAPADTGLAPADPESFGSFLAGAGSITSSAIGIHIASYATLGTAFCLGLLGLGLAVLALYLGSRYWSQRQKTGIRRKGRGWARAGIVLGLVGILTAMVLGFILMVIDALSKMNFGFQAPM